MKYEETFKDYEKMLYQGMLKGFLKNDYNMLYEYLYKRLGVQEANNWMLKGKKEKKYYCAKLISQYIADTNPELNQKALKYIAKFEGKK